MPSSERVTTAVRAVLAMVDRHDKTAAFDAVLVLQRNLPRGPHPIRHHLRAAQCGLDISNWDVAHHHLTLALAAESRSDA